MNLKPGTFTATVWTEPPGSEDFVGRTQAGFHSLKAAKIWVDIFGRKARFFTGGVTIYREYEDYGKVVASYELPRPAAANPEAKP